MKTLGIVAKRGKPEAVLLAQEIRARYPDKLMLADPRSAEALGWDAVEPERLAEQAELLIVLGGDGTLIHAARLARGRKVPILGVNLGTLGFLTEVPHQELFPTLDEVLAGRITLEPRMKLSCRLVRGGEVIVEDEVLNDVVLNRGALARIADHETFVNGTYVTTYKSDGVVLATPTGSTAYGLSAGGPIIHPALDCMLVAPICPHTLNQRPIVVPGDLTVRIALKSEAADVYLTLDGQSGHELRLGDQVEVTRSPHSAWLVRNPQQDYFSILRQKLHWGER